MRLEIKSFEGKYRFLSNFWKLPIPVNFSNISFFTTEAAYVAAKTTNQHLRRTISEMKPGQAKDFGNIIFEKKLWVNPDWNDEFRIVLMKNLVSQKFLKNTHLGIALLDTDDANIIEGNGHHDNFFGACTCLDCVSKQKLNHLGKIHMEVRNQLR
jgi:ribA/ribD-fused uncharacterized protein